jgi:hypothetical protein
MNKELLQLSTFRHENPLSLYYQQRITPIIYLSSLKKKYSMFEGAWEGWGWVSVVATVIHIGVNPMFLK